MNMKEIKDSEGRPWQVSLTVGSASRVRDMVSLVLPLPDGSGGKEAMPFDIVDAASVSQTLQVLRSNFTAVGETLYAILLPQVNARGLSREQFLDGWRGDALDDGAVAIEDEIISFFPVRLRGMVAAFAKKMTDLAETLTQQAIEKVNSMNPSELMSGESSGSAPESSAATQVNGPSEN